MMDIQTSILERIVYEKPKTLPHISDVLSEVPCFICPESISSICDVKGCHKLTAWLKGCKYIEYCHKKKQGR